MRYEMRRASFLEAPPFWPTRLADLDRLAGRWPATAHRVIGHSAGGRPLHCFFHGDFEEADRTATLSSALASGNPAAFFGARRRTKPVLLVAAAMHGQEVEGIAACLNLLAVARTGADLKGRGWPELRRLCDCSRLAVVPLLNPDGRERVPVNNLIGSDDDDVDYYGQGLDEEGRLMTWPEVKERQPLPADRVRLLGGYYNDAGVNVQHDDFTGHPAPETQAILRLAGEEVPDVVLTLHGCGNAPMFTGTEPLLPAAYRTRQAHLEAVVLQRLRREGYRPEAPRTSPRTGFNLLTPLYLACGCVPLLLELPHGMATKPFAAEEIVDLSLTAFEELLCFGAAFGFRPEVGG